MPCTSLRWSGLCAALVYNGFNLSKTTKKKEKGAWDEANEAKKAAADGTALSEPKICFGKGTIAAQEEGPPSCWTGDPAALKKKSLPMSHISEGANFLGQKFSCAGAVLSSPLNCTRA
eukprot:EG_transcript_35336